MATAQQERAPEKKKERPSALRSIIAGSTAGAVEIGMLLLTTPMNQTQSFANERLQLLHTLPNVRIGPISTSSWSFSLGGRAGSMAGEMMDVELH